MSSYREENCDYEGLGCVLGKWVSVGQRVQTSSYIRGKSSKNLMYSMVILLVILYFIYLKVAKRVRSELFSSHKKRNGNYVICWRC